MGGLNENDSLHTLPQPKHRMSVNQSSNIQQFFKVHTLSPLHLISPCYFSISPFTSDPICYLPLACTALLLSNISLFSFRKNVTLCTLNKTVIVLTVTLSKYKQLGFALIILLMYHWMLFYLDMQLQPCSKDVDFVFLCHTRFLLYSEQRVL